MKTTKLFALVTALAVCASTAVQAADQVPLKGSVAGVEIGVVQGGNLIVEGSATGTASGLGRYTMTYNVVVDLATGASIGTATFVGANGDSFSTTIVGQGLPTSDPTVVSIEEVETITGGTGRFSGATGTFTVRRLASLVTGVTSGSLEGTISNPGKR